MNPLATAHLRIARPRGEVFGAVRPANAFIQVVGFADPAGHVEIEAERLRDGDA